MQPRSTGSPADACSATSAPRSPTTATSCARRSGRAWPAGRSWSPGRSPKPSTPARYAHSSIRRPLRGLFSAPGKARWSRPGLTGQAPPSAPSSTWSSAPCWP